MDQTLQTQRTHNNTHHEKSRKHVATIKTKEMQHHRQAKIINNTSAMQQTANKKYTAIMYQEQKTKFTTSITHYIQLNSIS